MELVVISHGNKVSKSSKSDLSMLICIQYTAFFIIQYTCPQYIVVDSLVNVKLGAMTLNVVLYYARGETNPNTATNIVEFQQQQE